MPRVKGELVIATGVNFLTGSSCSMGLTSAEQGVALRGQHKERYWLREIDPSSSRRAVTVAGKFPDPGSWGSYDSQFRLKPLPSLCFTRRKEERLIFQDRKTANQSVDTRTMNIAAPTSNSRSSLNMSGFNNSSLRIATPPLVAASLAVNGIISRRASVLRSGKFLTCGFVTS